MALGLSRDVLHTVLHRLTLWDARSVQHAHPACAEAVHGIVQSIVERVLRAERSDAIDAFLKSAPGFHERVSGPYVYMRTPLTMRIEACCEGATVVMRVFRPAKPNAWACIEVMSGQHRPRPTFATLERTLQTIWWFSQALAASFGVDMAVTFRTRALKHHPPSEVLNTLATTFVERYCLGRNGYMDLCL